MTKFYALLSCNSHPPRYYVIEINKKIFSKFKNNKIFHYWMNDNFLIDIVDKEEIKSFYEYLAKDIFNNGRKIINQIHIPNDLNSC